MKRILGVLLMATIMLVMGCKKDDVIPSVEGTTWDVYVKWTTAPDTVLFYPRFDAGGTGVEVDGGGTPTGITLTWTQTGSTVTWTYPSTTSLTGTIVGDLMTGTGTTPGATSGWRAVKQ